MNNDHKK